MNFVITAHVPLEIPADAAPTRFLLIAPYNRDPRTWERLSWTDYCSGKSYAITTTGNSSRDVIRVRSYSDVFEEYRNHPEPKSLGPDGEPCGRTTSGELGRRPVFGTHHIYTGKESNRLEEVERGTIQEWDEVRPEYYDPKADPWRSLVVPVLKKMNRSELASLARVTERHIARLRNGREMPSPGLHQCLTRIAGDYARKCIGDGSELDDFAACASFLRRAQNVANRDLP
jgi:hypothetical protein